MHNRWKSLCEMRNKNKNSKQAKNKKTKKSKQIKKYKKRKEDKAKINTKTKYPPPPQKKPKTKPKQNKTKQTQQCHIVFTEIFKCFFFSSRENILYSYSILHSSMIYHGTDCQPGTVSSNDDLTC